VKRTKKGLSRFGVDRRHTVYDALDRRPRAGRIDVERGRGRLPRVKVLDVAKGG
jgi:hypothetical protein